MMKDTLTNGDPFPVLTRDVATSDDTTPPPGPVAAWIGFIELEAWSAAVDPARPVFLLPVAKPAGHDGPFHAQDLLVICQQVTLEGHVLYCRLKATTLTRVCGEVVDADWRHREMAWESLWECVDGLLEERGLRVLPATVACPADRPLLTGYAGGIRYDERHRCFRRTFPAAHDARSQLTPAQDTTGRDPIDRSAA